VPLTLDSRPSLRCPPRYPQFPRSAVAKDSDLAHGLLRCPVLDYRCASKRGLSLYPSVFVRFLL